LDNSLKKKNSSPYISNEIFNQGIEIYELDPNYERDYEELQEVLELYDLNFRGPVEPSKSQMFRLIRKGIFRVFILKKDDLPVGKKVAGMILTATWNQRLGIHIEYLAISNFCQGKGLGTILIRSLVNLMKKQVRKLTNNGPRLLTLECEQNLLSFYRRVEFQVSCIEPTIWEVEHNGIISLTKYYLMGISIDPHQNIGSLFDVDLMEKYRLNFKTKSLAALKL